MKKLLYLFSASLIVLTSCSKDDDNSSDPATSTLPQKIVSVDGTESETTTFTYNGNKIVSTVDSDGYKTNFTYTGDVITKTEEIDDKGVVDSTTEYAYTAGKLSSKTDFETGDNYKYRTKYTHNADGTIAYEEFRVNVATGVEQEYGYIGKYTFKDGNLLKEEKSYYGTVNTPSTYEYDTKNSILKNVTGYSLLLDNEEEISVNNVVKTTIGTYIYTNTYIYNENGFPTEQKSFSNGVADGTTTITY
jgi:hypothetical protein